MIIDKEEHRAILLAALKNLPVNGPICHPDLLANVLLAHEVHDAVVNALLQGNASLEMLESR